MSVDQVALESVCYDFLRTEYNGVNQPEQYPNWLGVDDYLHQAADKANWAQGITYDPEGDGTEMPASLGVHEHWNNDTDKKYSRNMGIGTGIELIAISGNEVNTAIAHAPELNSNLKIYPNPVTRGNRLNIILNDNTIEEVVIVDIHQRIVLHSKNSTGSIIIPENISPGIYVVRIKTTKGESISKVMVQ